MSTIANLSISPAADASTCAPAVEPQRPGPGFTLYSLADDLVSLLALREEMAEQKEDTAAIEQTIATYMHEHLPAKVDAVAHILGAFDGQEKMAEREIERLIARRRRIQSATEKLKRYCCEVLEMLPKPARGSRKLEGDTATLLLKVNGGSQTLDIYDESLVPDEYCIATITIPYWKWRELVARDKFSFLDGAKVERLVSNSCIRKALCEPCWACEGKGKHGGDYPDLPCPSCDGSGKIGVPGARLLERGSHLEVK